MYLIKEKKKQLHVLFKFIYNNRSSLKINISTALFGCDLITDRCEIALRL